MEARFGVEFKLGTRRRDAMGCGLAFVSLVEGREEP